MISSSQCANNGTAVGRLSPCPPRRIGVGMRRRGVSPPYHGTRRRRGGLAPLLGHPRRLLRPLRGSLRSANPTLRAGASRGRPVGRGICPTTPYHALPRPRAAPAVGRADPARRAARRPASRYPPHAHRLGNQWALGGRPMGIESESNAHWIPNQCPLDS